MGMILDYLGGDHRACDDLFASAEAAVAQKNGATHAACSTAFGRRWFII